METWTTRELPVLRALIDHFETPEIVPGPGIDDLAETTGLAEPDVKVALIALWEAAEPYIEGVEGAEARYPIAVTGVTERARRAVGQWPASDNAAEALVAAINEAAEAEPDEEKKSVLRRTAAALAGPVREVAMRVLTNEATSQVSQHLPHGHP